MLLKITLFCEKIAGKLQGSVSSLQHYEISKVREIIVKYRSETEIINGWIFCTFVCIHTEQSKTLREKAARC